MKQNNRYPWILVALLWGVALLNYLDRQMLSTMKAVIQQDIPQLQSAALFGQLMAVFLWVYAIASPFAGFFADRFNRKWVITGSLLVWSAVTVLMGLSHTFTQLYLLRAVMGLSEALYLPAALSLIAEVHTGKTRSLAVGLHMAGLYAGQALGGFGAMFSLEWSWKTTFLLMGGIGVCYAVLLSVFLRNDQKITARNTGSLVSFRTGWTNLKQLFANPYFLVMICCFAAPSLPGWGVKNWLPELFSENLKVGMQVAGPLSTITIAASSFAGVLLGGKLSDYWVQRKIRARIYVSASGLVLMIPALWLLGSASSLSMIITAASVFGIGFGCFDANNMPILCQIVPEGSRATAYGIMNMAGVSAGALVTAWLGRSTDAGKLGSDFSLMAVIVAAVVLLQLLTLYPRQFSPDDKKDL